MIKAHVRQFLPLKWWVELVWSLGKVICAAICGFQCLLLGILHADSYLALPCASKFYVFIHFFRVSRTAGRKPVLQTQGGWEKSPPGPLPGQVLPCDPWCSFGPCQQKTHKFWVRFGNYRKPSAIPNKQFEYARAGFTVRFYLLVWAQPLLFCCAGLVGYTGPKPFGWLRVGLPWTWH